MGRIETAGQVLVDLPETIELLGKSRATIYRLLTDNNLIRVSVRGTRTLYITLDSIERFKILVPPHPKFPTDIYSVDLKDQTDDVRREINRYFGRILTSRRGLPQMSLPFPDQVPSSGE